jgi:hypothetical protein
MRKKVRKTDRLPYARIAGLAKVMAKHEPQGEPYV